MVKATCLKENYAPITKNKDGVYKVQWDYTPIMSPIYAELTEEQEALVANGENVEREVIGEEESNMGVVAYETFNYKPTLEYIKNIILNYYNNEIDQKILSGFVWNDMPVWLSSENQFNYKAAYDLAIQTQGATLPVTFKFGTASEPVYYTFTNLEDFTSFYTQAIAYVNATLSTGWAKKDSIDWSVYEIND